MSVTSKILATNFKMRLVIFLATITVAIIVPLEYFAKWYFARKSPFPRSILADSQFSSIKEFKPESFGTKYGIDYHINLWGLRGSDIQSNKENESIVILGDSTSFGIGVVQNKIYPTLLTKELKKYQLVNASKPGFGTAAQLDFFEERLKRLFPKIVILAFFPNDLVDNKVYLAEKNIILGYGVRNMIDRILLLRANIRIYQLISFTVQRIVSKNSDDWTAFATSEKIKDTSVLSEEKELILKIKRISEENGAKFIVVYLPTKGEVPNGSFLHSWFKSMSRGENFIFLDMVEIYRKSTNWQSYYLLNDSGHPSAEGHRVISENLIQSLKLLIDLD